MQNGGLDDSHAGIKTASRYINNLRYADDTTLIAESEEELKSLLLRVKEESEKAGFKLNIKKNYDPGIWFHHFTANRWGNNGNSDRLYFLSSSITAEGDCSHEIKRHSFLGSKAINKPRQCIKKQRHHFANKGPYGQSYGFSWVGKIPWRRKQQPTPAFLPRESHGQRSLAGYSP